MEPNATRSRHRFCCSALVWHPFAVFISANHQPVFTVTHLGPVHTGDKIDFDFDSVDFVEADRVDQFQGNSSLLQLYSVTQKTL